MEHDVTGSVKHPSAGIHDEPSDLESMKIAIEDLEEDLAQAVFLDPYAMPAEVADVLINQLAGWPAKRWRELAALIAGYAEVEPYMPPTTPRDVRGESDELARASTMN